MNGILAMIWGGQSLTTLFPHYYFPLANNLTGGSRWSINATNTNRYSKLILPNHKNYAYLVEIPLIKFL
jgi:hypothetical protein